MKKVACLSNIISVFLILLPLKAYSQTESALIVSNTNDSGLSSFREAINQANNNSGPDSIIFNIPSSDPGYDASSGVWTIQPLTALPVISDSQTIINGFSQQDFAGNTNPDGLEIELDGSKIVTGIAHGLFIMSAKNTVQGLAICQFPNSGILLTGPSANENLLVNNFIGLNATITALLPNGKYGIYIVEGAQNQIGRLEETSLRKAYKARQKLFNKIPIHLSQQYEFTGQNVIAGNLDCGIYISGEVANSNQIVNNQVIFNESHGIYLSNRVKGTTIYWNAIAYNAGAGVVVHGENAIQNKIITNMITENGLEGILLEGGNLMLPAPEISLITENTITGTASPEALIQLFGDPEDEGKTIFGEAYCNAAGNFTWTGLIEGNNITATATDPNGNTSAFSEPYPFSGDLIVTTTTDNGPGSFRNALEQADTQQGPNRILFQIPVTDDGYDPNTGVWTIRPETPFNSIADEDLVIDGYSQSGFIGTDTNSEGPEIELDGSLLTDASGLHIMGSGAIIAGLVINRFDRNGIFLQNVYSGLITGCYIGTDAKGMQSMGNQEGIYLYYNVTNVVIGVADSTSAGNLISGNKSPGIMIQESCSHNYIIGNIIGPDVENAAMEESNSYGIYIADDCDSNQVLSNLIGSNRETGIYIHQNSNANVINGNQIGTDVNWQLHVGNRNGILISDSKNNQILENIIGLNEQIGVRIYGEGAIGNSLRRNSISNNGEKGIELSDGGNAGLSSPTLLSVTSTQVSGTAQAGQIIELFADENDQGHIYLGSVTVDATNNFLYDHKAPLPTLHITSTATDINGNTSAFSPPFRGGKNILVTTTADGGSGSLREAILEAEERQGSNRIVFQIPVTDSGYDANRGVWTIQPATALPWIIDDGLYLDGYSQSTFIGTDTNPQGPEIEIDGSLTNEVHGIWIKGSGVTIAGLAISHFNGAGIYVWDVSGGLITGCYLGVDASGTEPAGNVEGILLFRDVRDFVVGAPDSTYTGNIISGNTAHGISLRDSCKNNRIIGNRIGPNSTGSAMSENNWYGLYIEFSDSNDVFDNQIGFNNNIGIFVNQSNYCHIEGNEIGADETWQINMRNEKDGIYVENSALCQLIKNTVGYNKSNGIHIAGTEATNNLISENAISKNGLSGIELTFGGNEGISPPVIVSATTSRITGTAGGGQTVEIFNDDDDQGQIYLGSTLADAEGNFTFALNSSPQLANITATATDASGKTSTFSAPLIVVVETVASEQLPDKFTLHQNYPNPFNASTIIDYELPEEAFVNIKLFNIQGEEIATLINNKKFAGLHHIKFNATNLSSGVYFYQIKAKNFSQIKKMLLIQ